ncbi:MAG: hypothetical protein ACLQU1_04810 [Bryobacteraceae bacterium]
MDDSVVYGSGEPITGAVLTDTDANYVAQGTVALQGANPTLGIAAALSLPFSRSRGTADGFGNTASLSLPVPSSVSFTSASGIFDSAQVPEPSAFSPVGGSHADESKTRRRRQESCCYSRS